MSDIARVPAAVNILLVGTTTVVIILLVGTTTADQPRRVVQRRCIVTRVTWRPNGPLRVSAPRLPAATCATNVAARNCTLGAQHQVASCATNVAARNCTLGAQHQVARAATEHSQGVVAIFALLTHLVRLLPALRLLHRATLYATRAAAAAALVAVCSVALHAVTARAAAAAGRLLAPVAARATAAATSLALLADARFASTPSSPPRSPSHSRFLPPPLLPRSLRSASCPCHAVAVARHRRALRAPAVAPCALARRDRVRCLRRGGRARRQEEEGKTVVNNTRKKRKRVEFSQSS